MAGRLTVLVLSALLVCAGERLRGDAPHYHGNTREVVFPGPISKSAQPEDNPLMSIKLAKKMSLVQLKEDFFKLLNVTPPDDVSFSVGLSERFAGTQRSNAPMAKPAMCEPELQVVPVKEDPDPAAIYFPKCVRAKRCGGCCMHEALSCQPTATKISIHKIHVSKLQPGQTNQFNVFKENVAIEEHTACECDCKVKETDCIEKQYYNKEECRCVCKNADEESKCRQQSDKKYWQPSDCKCQCRRVEECATGFYFDRTICSCKSLPISNFWFSEERRPGYNNYNRQPTASRPKETPPVIVTLDASDPRRKHKEDPEYK